METNTIIVEDIPCFGSTSISVETAKTNFYYGPNGTGKSSIARKIRDLEFKPSIQNLSVELFDQDFVTRFIDPNTTIPGVFTVRAGSRRIQERLIQLEGTGDKRGEIDQAEGQLQRLQSTYEAKKLEIDEARKTFDNEVWKHKDKIPKELRDHGFKGFLGSKRQFSDEAKRRREFSANDGKIKAETEEVLVNRLSSLSAEGEVQNIELLPDVPEAGLIPDAVLAALEKSLSEDRSKPLSKLIEKLENTEWVREGVEHLNESGELCPFCQQQIQPELVAEIRDLFDSEYESAKQEIEALKRSYEESVLDIDGYLDRVKEIEITDTTELEKLLFEFRREIVKVLNALEEKLSDMSSELELKESKRPIGLEASLKSVNDAIVKYNSDLTNKERSLAELKASIWQCFIERYDFLEAYNTFKGKIAAPSKAIRNIERKIGDARDKVDDLREEYEECRSQLTSAVTVKDAINQNLKSLGFKSFHLDLVGDQEQYRIVRNDGQPAKFLSEGEKTLISFLYFSQYIEDLAKDKASQKTFWVVLDDPISSLDAQGLTTISHLCRSLAKICEESDGKFEKFMLFTHNAYFYQEAIYEGGRKQEDSNRRLYGLFRKKHDGTSEINVSSQNQVSSVYELLWQDLRDARESNVVSASVQNAMRRILEVYFRVIGKIGEEVVDKLDVGLQLPARSLLSWVNDGSHEIRWDLDSSHTNLDSDLYFQTFERIFDATGQKGHYDMMMNSDIPFGNN